MLFGTDAWDLAFDMGKIRRAVLLDKDTGSVKRDSSKEAFWDGLVPSCIEEVQRNPVRRPCSSMNNIHDLITPDSDRPKKSHYTGN